MKGTIFLAFGAIICTRWGIVYPEAEALETVDLTVGEETSCASSDRSDLVRRKG